eukprot:2090555-Rhodomonas_salina.1
MPNKDTQYNARSTDVAYGATAPYGRHARTPCARHYWPPALRACYARYCYSICAQYKMPGTDPAWAQYKLRLGPRTVVPGGTYSQARPGGGPGFPGTGRGPWYKAGSGYTSPYDSDKSDSHSVYSVGSRTNYMSDSSQVSPSVLLYYCTTGLLDYWTTVLLCYCPPVRFYYATTPLSCCPTVVVPSPAVSIGAQ